MEGAAGNSIVERTNKQHSHTDEVETMESVSPSQMIQIIDDEGSFNPTFDAAFHDLGLSSSGFGFNVITVLGCQSSGKSTLLNALFGTRFPEMDAMEGRNRTTLGLWAAKDEHSNTLVIDVEGTDSRERGEDRQTFEHRASLFSLVVADAVIINLWYQDLGRYTASNLGLLKTVLAVNLELFQNEPTAEKTTMIFVIRDYTTATPLSKLEDMIHKDVLNTWAEIKKPTELAHTQASQYFKFVVVGMPSKFVDPNGFAKGVTDLRQRWMETERPLQYSRGVPADGFSFYAKQVWGTIMSADQLDIPSQKEMVATYRCEEIKQNTLQEIRPLIWDASKENPKSLFDDKIAESAIEKAIVMYHQGAWRYQESVYELKRLQLLDSLYVEIQKSFDKYLHETRQQLLNERQKILEDLCRKDDSEISLMQDGSSRLDFWSTYPTRLSSWLAESLEKFDSHCGAASLNFEVEVDDKTGLKKSVSHDFDRELARRGYEESLNELVDKSRKAEQDSFKEYLSDRIANAREDIIHLFVDEPNPDRNLWIEVTSLLKKTAEQFDEEFSQVVKGLNGEKIATQDWLAIVLVDTLRNQFVQRLDFYPEYVHRRFKKRFEVDSAGVPHYWAGLSQDKIRALYVEAKKKSDTLLPMLKVFNVDMDSLLEDPNAVTPQTRLQLSKPIVTESKYREIGALASKRMLKSCQEAQFIQATGGRPASIPWFMWGLLLVFGWNELMMVLKSPVFSITVLTGGAVVVAAWYTGNAMRLANYFRSLISLGLGIILPLLTSLQSQGSGESGSKDPREINFDPAPTAPASSG